MDVSYPLPSQEYLLENLSAKPFWKSTMSLTQGKGINKDEIVLRGSSEERSMKEKEGSQSPGKEDPKGVNFRNCLLQK